MFLVVNADDRAAHIKEWGTGVGVINCCIRLNELTDGGLAQIAPQGAYDAGSHATRKSKRISDRKSAIADPDLVAVAEPSNGQWVIEVNLDDSQIDLP